MKANELRIGNWVLIPTNNEIKIPCLPRQIKAITLFGEFDFTEPQYPESHIVASRDCEGVKLTEEWLLKLGAKNMGGWIGLRFEGEVWGEKIEFTFELMEGTLTLYGGDVRLKKFNTPFVHELQNLYFALTGEELVIDQENLKP